MMKTSFIAIGAALIVIGLAVLVYTMPIVSDAAASKTPVYSESGVPKLPNNAMSMVPIEIAGVAPLIAGIALMAASSDGIQKWPTRDFPESRRTISNTGKAGSAGRTQLG